jgi:hypothetical protein
MGILIVIVIVAVVIVAIIVWFSGALDTCKFCGKTGPTNEKGLCNKCSISVEKDVRNRLRIMNDCTNLIDNSNNIKTIVSRYDLLLEQAQSLKIYESKGINLIPNPSQLLKKWTSLHDQIILERITSAVEEQFKKSETAVTPQKSLNAALKSLEVFLESKELVGDDLDLGKLENRARVYIIKKQLDIFREKANKAEFLGKNKKALEQHQEALYFLSKETLGFNEREEMTKDIENSIKQLSST